MVENSARLAQAVRSKGGTVVYVRVLVNELLRLPADISISRDPSAPPLPPQAWEIIEAAGAQPDDIVIDKRQWGAFQGTALDRAAQDLGYAVVFAEDAMSSLKAELHQFSVQNIFPIVGQVRSTAQLLATIE